MLQVQSQSILSKCASWWSSRCGGAISARRVSSSARSAPWRESGAIKKSNARARRDIRQKFLSSIPLGRMSQPSDIANACVWLGEDASSFITGVLLPVDGGRTA